MALSAAALAWLTETFSGDLRLEEPMSHHTSFQVGGPAEAWVKPRGKSELVRLVRWAVQQGIDYLPLGAGSNVLVRDAGIRGLVIALDGCLTSIAADDSAAAAPHITAGAGVKLAGLCALAIRKGLAGFNFALGIPGTVGGSIRVNAGTQAGCMGDVVTSINVLMPEGSLRSLEKGELAFSYRNLDWPDEAAFTAGGGPIILEAVFSLRAGKKSELKKEAARIMRQRTSSQPRKTANAGCIFKNPSGERSAGQLIDRAGLKGKRIGDAEVSPAHANFIVNRGQATAEDVLALMDLVKSTVYQRYQIQLETEVKIVG